MVKGITSETKDYRAELQPSRQKRAMEKPSASAAVSPSCKAEVPGRQPLLTLGVVQKNPSVTNAPAAELWKGNV